MYQHFPDNKQKSYKIMSSIGQEEARHKKSSKLKFGGGQANDRSSD
jgi:hypothetical protein